MLWINTKYKRYRCYSGRSCKSSYLIPKTFLQILFIYFCCWMFFVFKKKTPKIKGVLKTYNAYTHCSSKITMIKKDFNKLLSQLVHSQPWLSFLVEDDCHCGNITKLNKQNIVSSNQIFSIFDIKIWLIFPENQKKWIYSRKK